MDDFVTLHLRRNRGWPWPEDSWGLAPMFGDDGWCRSCGIPLRPQCGPLVLQSKGLTRCDGAWMPNWQFDVICLDESLATEVAARFRVDIRDVEWHGPPRGNVRQVVVPTVGTRWYEPQVLTTLTKAVHGSSGAACHECGRWRWLPLSADKLPVPQSDSPWDDEDVVASPEWFGDGWKALRQVFVRRELAELLASASPKDFAIHDVS